MVHENNINCKGIITAMSMWNGHLGLGLKVYSVSSLSALNFFLSMVY